VKLETRRSNFISFIFFSSLQRKSRFRRIARLRKSKSSDGKKKKIRHSIIGGEISPHPIPSQKGRTSENRPILLKPTRASEERVMREWEEEVRKDLQFVPLVFPPLFTVLTRNKAHSLPSSPDLDIHLRRITSKQIKSQPTSPGLTTRNSSFGPRHLSEWKLSNLAISKGLNLLSLRLTSNR